MKRMSPTATGQGRSVLCVDDDRDIAEIVEAILTDEGYAVSCLYEVEGDSLLRTIGRLEPDVVLLDSASSYDYSGAWESAATVAHRPRPVPTIMFTAHTVDADEAVEGTSARAKDAGFAAILAKPFYLDELLVAVAKAAGHSHPFDRGPAAEAHRTTALVKALEAKGATDIEPSKLREWAHFRDRAGRLVQLYWWQGRGVYQVGRYTDEGRMVMLGQFVDRDAAIDIALPSADSLRGV